MFDLSGRVALITGAGQNIGRGIARALGERGAAVAVNDLEPQRATSVADELSKSGIRAISIPFDVADHNEAKSAVAKISDQLGPVDVLVNNAGIPSVMGIMPFRAESPERWMPFLAVNALGPMNCVHAVLPSMRATGWGRIITISSSAHMGVDIGVSIYGAGKGAGVSFSRCIALEEAAAGITSNAIALGLIRRDGGYGELSEADVTAQIPVRRSGTPEEVGALCVYLASDEAGYMTAQTLNLNGGMMTS